MPERVQLQRKAGWRLPANTKSVARPGIYGNPWRVTREKVGAGDLFKEIFGTDVLWIVEGPAVFYPPDEDRAAAHTFAVQMYRDWLTRDDWANHPVLGPEMRHRRERILQRLPELRGHNLACWCESELPCHADVLLELAANA